jgi:hypothetical protein
VKDTKSKQQVSNVGRDNYNIVGKKHRLKIDNRTGEHEIVVSKIVIDIFVGLVVAAAVYFIGWHK